MSKPIDAHFWNLKLKPILLSVSTLRLGAYPVKTLEAMIFEYFKVEATPVSMRNESSTYSALYLNVSVNHASYKRYRGCP